jgi:hypothetical protein
MLLRYPYTISKLCASISNFVFFAIGVSLSDPAWAAVAPTLYWIQIAVCTLHCQCKPITTRGSCAARAVWQRRLHSAAPPHRPHRPQHRQQPPERRSDQQSTSSWTWFQSHRGRRGGRQGSRCCVLWTTTMVWTMGAAVDSISRFLNRYRIINIDIEAITSISKLQLGVPHAYCEIHALVVGPTRLFYIEE